MLVSREPGELTDSRRWHGRSARELTQDARATPALKMELSQLEFFVTVVEEGGFSKAAERVFRTQPAVSIAIRRLEEDLGTSLFERSQKAPVLTEAGELFYDYARRILALR